MNENKVLDSLVSEGVLKGYTRVNVDGYGNVGKTSEGRNTERLVLKFNSGHVLRIDSFCSGCLENTVFSLSDDAEESKNS